MIQRGIEYTDVENAIYHGHIKKIGIQFRLPVFQAIGVRFGKYVTVVYYNEGNCAYLKTVRRAKQSEIKLYKKYKR